MGVGRGLGEQGEHESAAAAADDDDESPFASAGERKEMVGSPTDMTTDEVTSEEAVKTARGGPTSSDSEAVEQRNALMSSAKNTALWAKERRRSDAIFLDGREMVSRKETIRKTKERPTDNDKRLMSLCTTSMAGW